MEGGVEFDSDDVFYANLSKQLYLMLDDSEEDVNHLHRPHYQSVNLQAYSGVVHPATSKRGTGVFIPNPVRKMRQGKFAVPANKFQRAFDHENTTGLLPNVSFGSRVIQSQDQQSCNYRKF